MSGVLKMADNCSVKNKDLLGHFKDGMFYIERISDIAQMRVLTVNCDNVDESEIDIECRIT
jgi:hypothetical protein